MRLMWKGIKYVFIDEVSMIPHENFVRVNQLLQENTRNTELFGGLNVILFGDLMQLPPVFGHPIFKQPRHDV